LIEKNDVVWKRVPGLLSLVPPLIGMRGNIFGSLASRISTEVQNGTPADVLDRLVAFFDQYVIIEVLLLSTVLALVTKAVDWNEIVLADLLFNNAVNGVVTGHLLLFVTKRVVRLAVRFKVNPDNVAPTVITTFGDIITVPVIVVIVRYLLDAVNEVLQLLVTTVVFVYLGVLLWRVLTHERAAFFTVARQRIPVLLCCSLFSFLAGLVLESLSDNDQIRQFILLLPLMNSQGGSIGSCISSRLSTIIMGTAAAAASSTSSTSSKSTIMSTNLSKFDETLQRNHRQRLVEQQQSIDVVPTSKRRSNSAPDVITPTMMIDNVGVSRSHSPTLRRQQQRLLPKLEPRINMRRQHQQRQPIQHHQQQLISTKLLARFFTGVMFCYFYKSKF
jgi:cation transporter-like permease